MKKISRDSKLYFAEGIIVFSGIVNDTALHRHHSIQLSISFGENLTLLSGQKEICSRAVIIDSNAVHKLNGEKSPQLLILLEPETSYAESLKKFITEEVTELKFTENFYQILEKSAERKLESALENIFEYFSFKDLNYSKVDHRVKKIIAIVKGDPYQKFEIKKLSGTVSLSESRLQHLFKEQIGISIKRYLLWIKMQRAVSVVLSGQDFTYAAYEAGFADSAHLSRTFKDHFGINLSDVFKNSRSLQVTFGDNSYITHNAFIAHNTL